MNIIKILSAFLVFFLISCTSTDTNSAKENEKASYEQARQSLLQKEQKNPKMFLTATANDKKNLIGQTVVKGKMSNNATIAVYKDVEIKLEFYSKTKTLLESENETIFLELKPGQTESFKTKYFAPKGTDSVAVSVINAKVAELP